MILNIRQAADVLKVSEITVRNWMKSGLLNNQLSYKNVSTVKDSISSGEIMRLNKRANKSGSSKSFIPAEYTSESNVIKILKKITEKAAEHFSSTDHAIYNIAIAFIDEKELSNSKSYIFKRIAVQKVIDKFIDKSFKQNIGFIAAVTPLIKQLKKSQLQDVLGLIYQSLITEGYKSQKGSYYTPIKLINDLISDLSDSMETFLDPCCGTGAFILSVVKNKRIHPDNIYGVDIDKTAVFLARINILEAFKKYDKIPNIFHLDSLTQLATGDFGCETNFLIGQIDAIATNPPWGANKNASPSAKYRELTGSKESFSMFLIQSLDLLKTNGELNFLLPEAILNIKTHKNIRGFICKNTQIIRIKEFGRAFTGVYSPVVSIHLKNTTNNQNNLVKIRSKKSNYTINQDRFLQGKNFLFDIKIDDEKKKIIDKIYATPHVTLKGNAKWALGIVTGDNKKHIKYNCNNGMEPIYKGSDLAYYHLKSASGYIDYKRNSFQQAAKDNYYRANEKLIYKFISNKLVFAYDSGKSLTLNSANILIPDFQDIPLKVVLAFLNSEVFQFLHKIKFSTHKILKGNLEELPFPNLDNQHKTKIVTLVNKAIKGDQIAIEKIEKEIYRIFQLNKSEMSVIKNFIK